MSEDKKPVPAGARDPQVARVLDGISPAKPTATAQRPDGIPVAFIQWDRPLQFAGMSQDDHVNGRATPAGPSKWTLAYLPELRHFRVEYADKARPEKDKTTFHHESRALRWEPA